MASISRMASSVSSNWSTVISALVREVRPSHRSKLLARFVRPVNLTGGNLLQGAVDLLIKSAAFFVGPALFSVQSFQGSAENIFYVGAVAAGETLLNQILKIGGDIELYGMILLV